MSRRKLILSIYSSAMLSFSFFFSLVWFGSDRFYIYKLLGALSFFLSFPFIPFLLSPAPSRSDFFPILLRVFSFLYSDRFTQKLTFPVSSSSYIPIYLHTRKKLNLFLTSFFLPLLLYPSSSSSGIIPILLMFPGTERVLYNH